MKPKNPQNLVILTFCKLFLLPSLYSPCKMRYHGAKYIQSELVGLKGDPTMYGQTTSTITPDHISIHNPLLLHVVYSYSILLLVFSSLEPLLSLIHNISYTAHGKLHQWSSGVQKLYYLHGSSNITPLKIHKNMNVVRGKFLMNATEIYQRVTNCTLMVFQKAFWMVQIAKVWLDDTNDDLKGFQSISIGSGKRRRRRE